MINLFLFFNWKKTQKQKCFTLPSGLPDWKQNPESCMKWRRFAKSVQARTIFFYVYILPFKKMSEFFSISSLFESSQSLFWASFGLMDLSNFELTGVKSYVRLTNIENCQLYNYGKWLFLLLPLQTRFWGMLIFGSYSVINVVVLLNLLIAMMSNSYALITVWIIYKSFLRVKIIFI